VRHWRSPPGPPPHTPTPAGGFISYTPETGWNGGTVCDPNKTKWEQLGGEYSVLGEPSGNGGGTPDGKGKFNHFQSRPFGPEDGSIYWTARTGAWSIHGAIRDKWRSMGWERSPLGYPVTDETGTPDGIGRFNHFSSTGNSTVADGSIYFTGGTGAVAIRGAIRSFWAQWGWENGPCGYPTEDEKNIAPGLYTQRFQYGTITFTAGHGSDMACHR